MKPLHGQRVLVVAQTPGPDQPAAVLEAEEAVTDLVRALAAAGARVEMVADASLSLLAGVVAGEYVQPPPAEAMSRAHEGEPRRGEERMRAEDLRVDVAPVRLHSRAPKAFSALRERGAIEMREAGVNVVGELAPESVALVVIGEGEAITTAVRQFRDSNGFAPIFAFGSTGRTARELHERFGARAIDLELEAEEPPRSRRTIERRSNDAGHPDETEARPVDFEFQFPPVALAAQEIVRTLRDRLRPEDEDDQSPES